MKVLLLNYQLDICIYLSYNVNLFLLQILHFRHLERLQKINVACTLYCTIL